ncbi:hypothetical protein CSOJ01_05781 [Colletotrichum sojae]|uniref:Uncharacterized protein n=1 Tax=Colletotrichum sojae TaxID=2175907 RepID=A0A8H6MWA4_9PEZI|nr:hypothetical protein CSOJ01_05781 [Colletotrichum sojae]
MENGRTGPHGSLLRVTGPQEADADGLSERHTEGPASRYGAPGPWTLDTYSPENSTGDKPAPGPGSPCTAPMMASAGLEGASAAA